MRTGLRLLEAHRDELMKLVMAKEGIEGGRLHALRGIPRDARSMGWAGAAAPDFARGPARARRGCDLGQRGACHLVDGLLCSPAAGRAGRGAYASRGPFASARFSQQDDANEAELLRLAQNRNGANAALLSLIITGTGEMVARLWSGSGTPVPISDITVVGRRLSLYKRQALAIDEDILSRQALVFGQELNRMLRGLRVGVVGLSGTGSPHGPV